MNRREFLFQIGITLNGSYSVNKDSVIKRVKIKSKKLQGLSVLAIADIHISRFFQPSWDQFNFNLGQDLSVLLGDYFYIMDFERSNMEFVNSLIRNFDLFLQSLSGIVPVMAVLGNHDRKHYRIPFKEILSKYGVSLLVNEGLSFRGIEIFGSDDFLTGFPQLPPYADLVITHNPDYFCYLLSQASFKSFTVAGHTHGGQITVFGKPILLNIGCTKYVSGYFKEEWGELYVSNGLGVVGIPLRFNAPSEITLLEFV
ncbi:MAG: metallophosphoesterase [Deltaproteobacteria bacterium]|nr:metallophosphoesterase [Deltaproteobacteria bacterium]